MKYDATSQSSIMAHALTILGKSLRELYPEAVAGGGKGNFGNSMEFYHFGYENNNNPEPDFNIIGYDLKCTPLDPKTEGYVAGERLVLTMIDFIEEAKVNHYTESHFWKKAKLLLIFYLRIKNEPYLDYIVQMIRWWNIPETDLKIIIDDWNIIHNKIKNGLAHELSESDTLYLGACTKSSDSSVTRKQFGTNILAKPRAYCLKKQYMYWLVVDSFLDKQNVHVSPTMKLSNNYMKKVIEDKKKLGVVVNSINDYSKGETFEDFIERKFSEYYGLTLSDISNITGIQISSKSKDYAYQTCLSILGLKTRKIAEFEKAGIQLKSICLENSMDRLKESMSFPAINYVDLANEEDWEDSEWYNTLSRRFFFVVFQKSLDNNREALRLKKVFFWGMPTSDVERCKIVWKDTRDKVRADIFDNFMGISSHPICHIRPHAKDSSDTTITPSGRFEGKKCFWLTNHYILKVVLSKINQSVRQSILYSFEYEQNTKMVADNSSIDYNK